MHHSNNTIQRSLDILVGRSSRIQTDFEEVVSMKDKRGRRGAGASEDIRETLGSGPVCLLASIRTKRTLLFLAT